MDCPRKDNCMAKDWYPIFREVYIEREWDKWKQDFCESGQFEKCCFYQSKGFRFNPSKRHVQSEKAKKVIRILEGKE
jgi:hypothetical protein